MPVIVAFFVRQLIVIGVQLGIFAAIDKFVTPLLNEAIQRITIAFGVDEKEAENILANEVITTAESLGLTVALSKARLPLVIAERLGFTSKGFSKRRLTSSTEQKVRGKTTASVKSPGISTAEVQTLATEIAVSRGVSFAKVNEVVTFILKIASFPFLVIFTLAQVVDFGNWNSGAYQTTWQKILAVVTFGALVPDPQIPKSSVLSSDVWNKVYNTYKEQGARGINDPYKNQTVLFTRENLIDLVDQIASALLLETGEAGAKAVFAATTALITLKPPTGGPIVLPGIQVQAPIASPRVFTGLVSQGVLGARLEFTARPDDLIESIEELKAATQNNLAPFLVALPGRVVYEIKIVSSITTKDGFTQRGTAQRIVSGKYASGAPKYRTVVNKFALLNLYIMTERGARTKISSIVLGPTDAVKFQPAQNELAQIEAAVRGTVLTSSLADVENVTPTAATTPKYATDESFFLPHDTNFLDLYRGVGNELWEFPTVQRVLKTEEIQKAGSLGNALPLALARLKEQGIDPTTWQRVTFVGQAKTNAQNAGTFHGDKSFEEFFGIPKKTPEEIKVQAGGTATTLFEYYQARGEQLPSIEVRSRLYQELALGQASYYTGTAEQNTKLLTKLRGK